MFAGSICTSSSRSSAAPILSRRSSQSPSVTGLCSSILPFTSIMPLCCMLSYMLLNSGRGLVKRTTIFVDDDLLVEAQHLAKRRGITFTALIDEALRAHVQAQQT